MTETLLDILKSLGYGLAALALCWLARLVYTLNPAAKKSGAAPLAAGSPAEAAGAGGYFLAVILSLGGPISWAAESFLEGAAVALGFGALAVVLLNASIWAADKTYLRRLRLEKRVAGGSLGAGLLRAAHETALGLVILGASWGDNGGVMVMLSFWLLGQVLLGAAVTIYFKASGFDLGGELDKGNTAAALSAAGMLAGFGLIAWSALSGPFLGWGRSILDTAAYYAAGALGITAFRAAADFVLLPGATFRGEILKGNGNVAAGVLDASLTVGMAILLTWCLM